MENKTIYVKLENYNPKDFNIVEEYPNKQIKKCLDKYGKEFTLHIIYPEDIVDIKELTPEEITWWLGKKYVDKKIIMLSCNWFPSELLIGVKKHGNKRYYSADTELSRQTGYIEGSGNLGSRSYCFFKEKIKQNLQILKDNGFDKFNVVQKTVEKKKEHGRPGMYTLEKFKEEMFSGKIKTLSHHKK